MNKRSILYIFSALFFIEAVAMSILADEKPSTNPITNGPTTIQLFDTDIAKNLEYHDTTTDPLPLMTITYALVSGFVFAYASYSHR